MSVNILRKFTGTQIFVLTMCCANHFMFSCALSMIAPFYPKEVSERGGDEVIGGLIFSFYALLTFAFAPIFGELTPRLGLKTTLSLGLMTSGIGNILFGSLAYVKEKNVFVGLSFVFRTVESLGGSAFITTSNVVISHTFPNNVGFIRGLCEIFISLGYSLGPAIGGILYSLGGFELPFILLGSVMILVTPLNRHIISNGNVDDTEKKSGLLFKMLRIPTIFLTALIIMMSAISWSFLEPTLEPHLRKYDLPAKYVGLIFLLYSAAFGISGPLAGWISDKKPKYMWHLMISGLIVVSGSLLILGPTTMQSFFEESLYSNCISLVIFGFGWGFAFLPTYQSLMAGAIEKGYTDDVGTQSVVSAIWLSSYSFGNILGPVTAGVLYTNLGFALSADIFSCANLIMAVIVIIYCFYRNLKKSEEQDANVQMETYTRKTTYW